MNVGKKKTRDDEIKELLVELEQDLGSFKLNIDQKDKKK